MIFTSVIGNIDDLVNNNKDLEIISLPYEALSKDILRVQSNLGNEYGINIDHQQNPLHHGDILAELEDRYLVVQVEEAEMIVITPHDINEMGVIAHMLGNTHKPVIVENGQIILEVDPVVVNLLNDKGIDYQIKAIVLNEPLQHVNLSHTHTHE